jgi:hypothetical protein
MFDGRGGALAELLRHEFPSEIGEQVSISISTAMASSKRSSCHPQRAAASHARISATGFLHAMQQAVITERGDSRREYL